MKLVSTLLALSAPVAIVMSMGSAQAREGIVITAEPDALVRTLRVGFGDIDLSAAEGQDTLNRRVSLAVREVCAAPDQFLLSELPCKRAAWSDARPQIANAVERARSNPGLAMAGSIIVRAAR
jgi:UrcA family protein